MKSEEAKKGSSLLPDKKIRNQDHIRYYCKVLDQYKDPLYDIFKYGKGRPGFIQHYNLLPTLNIILGMDKLLNHISQIQIDHQIVYGYDTTFNCGDAYYLSILTARHPLLKRGNTTEPIIPVFISIHEDKSERTHRAVFNIIKLLIPEINNANSIIVTDR